MMVNFRVLSCLFLLVIFFGRSQDVFARKRLKLFRVKIIHYDNAHTKGILFDINKDGIVLARAKDVTSIPQDMILKSIREGSMQRTSVPFDQIKKVGLWRRRAAGRNFVIGALGSMVVAGTITLISTERNNNDDTHCGCGPPAVLIIPPVVAILGGAVGALVGVLPKKAITLNPDRLYESANEQLGKYSIATQLQ